MIWAKDLNSRGEVISARLKGPQEIGIITFILTLTIVPSIDPQNFIPWIDCHFYFLASTGLLYCAKAIFSVYPIWTSFASFEMLGQSCRIIVYEDWFLFSFSKLLRNSFNPPFAAWFKQIKRTVSFDVTTRFNAIQQSTAMYNSHIFNVRNTTLVEIQYI